MVKKYFRPFIYAICMTYSASLTLGNVTPVMANEFETQVETAVVSDQALALGEEAGSEGGESTPDTPDVSQSQNTEEPEVTTYDEPSTGSQAESGNTQPTTTDGTGDTSSSTPSDTTGGSGDISITTPTDTTDGSGDTQTTGGGDAQTTGGEQQTGDDGQGNDGSTKVEEFSVSYPSSAIKGAETSAEITGISASNANGSNT